MSNNAIRCKTDGNFPKHFKFSINFKLIKMISVFYLILVLLGNANGMLHFKVQNYALCDVKPFKTFVEGVKLVFTGMFPTIKLGTKGESAALIEQVWNETNVERIKQNCTFVVSSSDSENEGFYVFLKNIKFRTDHESKCMDYIDFSGAKKSNVKRVCGEMKNEHVHKQEGDLYVNIFINRRYPLDGPLELEMIITSFTECERNDDFVCDAAKEECISKVFVKDGYPHCYPPCRDEDNYCYARTTETIVRISPSNIALTALTSLIVTMAAVSLCVWVTYKYRRFCYPEAVTRRESGDVPTIEMPTSPIAAGAAGSNTEVTAPPIKDLPPSYESLFPER